MNEDKRYYGIYAGVCTNNQDPDATYKVQVVVPQVTGAADSWAAPCFPVTVNGEHGTDYGLTVTSSGSSATNTGISNPSSHSHTMAHTHTVTLNPHIKLPEINQTVWIMYVAGDPNFPVWMGVQI